MILTDLPAKISLLVINNITDPIDMHALRRTLRRFNALVAPRFEKSFPPNFQLTIAYWDLILSPWGEATAADLNSICVPRTLRADDLVRRSHDALIHHAASRHHIRQLRSILSRPFPPAPCDERGNRVHLHRVWVVYQNALWSAAQRGWAEGLRELWRHRPVGWVMDRDTERETRWVFYGPGDDLSEEEEG